MSRTYRKKEAYQLDHLYWKWSYCIDGTFTRINVKPTKKELALAESDGGTIHFYHSSCSHKWYFNQVSRKYRCNDIIQKNKIYRLFTSNNIDYLDDIDYDLSKGTKKRKGIMWEIY